MIKRYTVTDPTSTHIKWWPEVPALKQGSWTFKPGLNILWGKNGSGKSTLIKAMARLMHCEQAGRSVVTQHSKGEFCAYDRKDLKTPDLREVMQLEHDGQGVNYFDPGNAVGLVGGMAGFDYDFTGEGLKNIALRKASAGQVTSARADDLVGSVIERRVNTKVDIRAPFQTGKSGVWSDEEPLAHFLKGNIPKGQPTVLLDEPARSLDIPAQAQMWGFIRAYQDEIQFIVASHSLFALEIPGANYIELSPGYLTTSLHHKKALATWAEREYKPLDIPPGNPV